MNALVFEQAQLVLRKSIVDSVNDEDRNNELSTHCDTEYSRQLFGLICFEHTCIGYKDNWYFELNQFLNGWFGNGNEIRTFGNDTINIEKTGKVWLLRSKI